ncbi:MAG: type I restriction enzyme HsdR N-terminal domain-containing protein [Thermococcus sp.]|uniref:Restriction endonuclease n=1 Tax=Thermococcus guaymasensis DSM 11113 TaxID=1432656 RepID=A0A0X1KKV9_9EURY|nr:type I restriction enzyme HsdR N-terminal domain-containing protein [Thermococcus guaymasensis]AJC71898.1 restriction endonuclease [Thermococcus guaymasensis DSM 11113]MCD6524213.1 type I restriction enzyme HsdR N-terminal domain-containing protein [Thermococcus sp.]
MAETNLGALKSAPELGKFENSSSDVGSIVGSIVRVLKKINAHRKLYETNEEAVKQHLIGEIMRALGWEWDNPEEVRPESRTEEGRADYALILGGEIVAYVEAKNLGVNIEKREEPLRQLAKYCFNTGVRYGILTNGAVWIGVKAFEVGSSLRERTLVKVNLLNEPPMKAALKLSLFSKSRILEMERISSLLKALELSFMGLIKEGYPREALFEYLKVDSGKRIVPIHLLEGHESPKVAYVYDNGWKLLPLPERTMKGVLLAVLLYMGQKAFGDEKREIMAAYEQLKRIPLEQKKAHEILVRLEEEKKLNISVEL